MIKHVLLENCQFSSEDTDSGIKCTTKSDTFKQMRILPTFQCDKSL